MRLDPLQPRRLRTQMLRLSYSLAPLLMVAVFEYVYQQMDSGSPTLWLPPGRDCTQRGTVAVRDVTLLHPTIDFEARTPVSALLNVHKRCVQVASNDEPESTCDAHLTELDQ